MDSYQTPSKEFSPGMGQAVADRTVTRKKANGTRESWADVAERVALGNTLLNLEDQEPEFHKLHHHLRQASILMSGRHLQHGDETQPTRNMEVFTNCSTSALRAGTFYLLLNGSGVGEDFSDDMMLVDWSKMPTVVPVIDWGHKDRDSGLINGFLTRSEAEHLYKHAHTTYFRVEDSREGWALAVAQMEIMAFEQLSDEVLILDFTGVRPSGSPIGGMQNRPASGPGPLMSSIRNISAIKGSKMPRWRQNMYVSHYLAECVLVGGARRAARMATKHWKDETVLGFIEVKRGGFLWSANNSVTVDDEFWKYVKMDWDEQKTHVHKKDYLLINHAKLVLDRIAECSYFDGTGEPGLINQAKLTEKREGLEDYLDGRIITGGKLQLPQRYLSLTQALARVVNDKEYVMITNPCGEITLTMLGGYCVISDVVPYHAQSLDDAIDAFRTATRSLIRVNLMDCMYRREVDRTNRIGVGMTGLHEFAWKFFKIGFRDMIKPDFKAYQEAMLSDFTLDNVLDFEPGVRAAYFWHFLSACKLAVQEEARSYSIELGVNTPHTDTTMKPAGTTSKLFALSEGAHLPAMAEYLRWVQFRNDDPLVQDYAAKGYPIKELKSYSGTTVVGFPTETEICRLGMGDALVTAAEATPEEQYEYLRLLEEFWITGVYSDSETGNQVSYTLKYDPKVVGFEQFKQTLIDGQSTIRCCSVMPQVDGTAYEYQPEQPISREEFDNLVQQIEQAEKEDIGFEHVDCGSGACPIDFNK